MGKCSGGMEPESLRNLIKFFDLNPKIYICIHDISGVLKTRDIGIAIKKCGEYDWPTRRIALQAIKMLCDSYLLKPL